MSKTQLQIAVLTLEQYLPWVRGEVDKINCTSEFLIALETAVRIVKEQTEFKPGPITADNLRAAVAPWFDGDKVRRQEAYGPGIPRVFIEAIGALRKATVRESFGMVRPAMRLADARWAIEHWPEFVAFVEKNGRLPDERYDLGLR